MSHQIDISHLAKLIQLPISDKEVSVFSTQFEATLKTVATLEELDTSSAVATPAVNNLSNIFRDDIIDEARMFTNEQALKNAPQTYQGYFVVPAVLKK